MKYDIVILICIIAAAGLFFLTNADESTEVFRAKYDLPQNVNTEPGKEILGYEWIVNERLKEYKAGLKHLSSALLNISGLIVLGLLLLFYRPSGINVSFLSLKIPESLLYMIVVVGALYLWQNLGLQLNSSIDSRLSLHYSIEELTPTELQGMEQAPTNILVDNALVDNWVGYYFNLFDVEDANKQVVKTLEALGLYGLFGTLFALLYAVCFATIIEFGERVKESAVIANILLTFALLLLLVANVAWLTLHPYASGFTGYYWFMAGMLLFAWKARGKYISRKLANLEIAD